VQNVGRWTNLRHLGEPLRGAESLLFAASFKKTMKSMGRMPDGSEMQAVWLYTSPIIIRNNRLWCIHYSGNNELWPFCCFFKIQL